MKSMLTKWWKTWKNGTKVRRKNIFVGGFSRNLLLDEWLEFSEKDCPSNNEIFAQSYHQLAHSGSLGEILEKEKNYATSISSLVRRMEKETQELHSMHQEVMDSKINLLDVETTPDDINQLLAQQYSTSNLMRKQFESEKKDIWKTSTESGSTRRLAKNWWL